MNPVDPLNSNQYFGLTATPSKSELNSEMFLRLLTVQLANQNPLEPMNDRDFFAQMAQLGTVDGLEKMQKSMEVAQAASLIGKTVTALRPMTDSGSGFNEVVTGEVVRLTVRNGEHWLSLREVGATGLVDVRMNAIRTVEGSSATP
jgi:flagellar basal-body rod modification protein FlgD